MNPDVYPETNEELFREVFSRFSAEIPAEWGVDVSLAAEYMIVPGFEKRVVNEADRLLAYPDKSILVEMSYRFKSQNLEKALFELGMAGFKPILAHPERYTYLASSLEVFERWQDMGCRFQMNLLSTSGAYGPESLQILQHLLSHGMYSFVATDLHSVDQLERILAVKPGFFLRRKLKGLDELIDGCRM